MTNFDPKEKIGKNGGIVLREPIRSYDGIELLRAKEAKSERLLLAKQAKDRNLTELAQWEHVMLGRIEHPLAIRPLYVTRDNKDHVLFVYQAEAFVTGEGSEAATLDARQLVHDMLDLLATLHARGIVRIGVDPSSFWLRGEAGVLRPVLVALRPQAAIPTAEAYRPNASAHDRPRLRVEAASLSPEALLGEETDVRSDLYVFGAAMYEILSGVPPVSADDAWTALQNRALRPPAPLRDLRPDLPEAIGRVVGRLLAFAPGERYSSAIAALRALEGDDTPAPRGVDPERRTPASIACPDLAGRASALTRLETAYESSMAGTMRVAYLLGDEGMGKTRLVDEFLARLKLRGVATYRGRYLPDERAVYFRSFASLFHVIYPPGRRIPDEVDAVASLIFPELVPASRQRPRGRRNGAPRREHIHEMLGRLVLALSPEGGPICLVLEQIAGDDPDHAALVSALARQLQGKNVFMIVTLRPGSEPLAEGDEAAAEERVDLGPLPTGEMVRVLASAAGKVDAGPDTVALAEQGMGNPFIGLELLRHSLTPEARPSDTLPPLAGSEDAVQRRLATLPDEERLCLEAGAVVGNSFDRQAMMRVAELGDDEGWERIARLQTEDFLRASAAGNHLELSFPHPAYRRAVLKSASPGRRALLHLRTAHALENRFKRGSTEVLWDLAYHFSRAGDEGRNARYNALAADRAADLFAIDAALRFYKTAVMTGQSEDRIARVSPKLEGLLGLMGREEEVRAISDGAPQIAPVAEGDAEALVAQGRDALFANDFRKAIRLLTLAADRARDAGDRAHAGEATWRIAVIERRLGAYARAVEHLDAAAGLLGEDPLLARALVDHGRVLMLRGDAAGATEKLSRALELARAGGDPFLVSYAHAWKARHLLASGRDEAARAELDEAQSFLGASKAEPERVLRGQMHVHLALGAWYERARRDNDALAQYERVVTHGVAARERLRALVGQARSYTRLDRLHEADQAVHNALVAGQTPGASDLAWQAHSEAGRAFRIGGRLDDALHAYLRAVAAIEALMDMAPLGRAERAAFLKHDERLKAFRSLLAVRLLIDKSPSLIEFAADDYLISVIERFYDDRYRQRKKLTERLERMVEWLLRNREQIRVRRTAAPAPAAAAETSSPRNPPPRLPRQSRLEGKNLLRMSAILETLGDVEDLKVHILDMALDIVDADRGAIALLEGTELKCSAARELKGREAEDAMKRLETLRGMQITEDSGAILCPPKGDGFPHVLLPLTKGDSLKGGIYIDVADLGGISDVTRKYLKGFATIAIMSLDTAKEWSRMLQESGRLAKENRKLQQDVARVQRERGSMREEAPEDEAAPEPEEQPRRSSRRHEERERRAPRERELPVEAEEAGEAREAREARGADESPAPDAAAASAPGEGDGPRLSRRARRAQEKQEIVDVLRGCDFDRNATAEKLGISRSTLNTRLRRYNIRINRLRAPLPPAEGEGASLAVRSDDSTDTTLEGALAGVLASVSGSSMMPEGGDLLDDERPVAARGEALDRGLEDDDEDDDDREDGDDGDDDGDDDREGTFDADREDEEE